MEVLTKQELADRYYNRSKDSMVNKVNFSRHTNTEQYHALTIQIEKEVSNTITYQGFA